jgi:hypothetical protein
MLSGAVLAQCRTAKSGSTCTVEYAGKVHTIEVARDLTVAVGDMLCVARIGPLWVAVARLYASAAAVTFAEQEVPDPNVATITGTTTVLPVYTGSYRDGAWRTDTTEVVQGIRGAYGNSVGAVFYGAKPASLAGSTISAGRITVTRTAGPAAATASTLWLVTETTPPAGTPTRTLSTAGPTLAIGETAEFTIPTAWAQALADGTSGGLALYDADGSPWLAMAGRGDMAGAFTLALDWARTP